MYPHPQIQFCKGVHLPYDLVTAVRERNVSTWLLPLESEMYPHFQSQVRNLFTLLYDIVIANSKRNVPTFTFHLSRHRATLTDTFFYSLLLVHPPKSKLLCTKTVGLLQSFIDSYGGFTRMIVVFSSWFIGRLGDCLDGWRDGSRSEFRPELSASLVPLDITETLSAEAAVAQESALEFHDLLPVGLVPAQQLLRLLHDRVVVVLLLLHFVVLGGWKLWLSKP